MIRRSSESDPYARSTAEVEAMGRHWIVTSLRVVGWIGLAASLLAALIIAYSRSEPYGQYQVGPALAVGVVGVVQSLILIGFASMISYMKASALGTRVVAVQAKRTADLLSQNLDEVRNPGT
jgi:hypothetical protein